MPFNSSSRAHEPVKYVATFCTSVFAIFKYNVNNFMVKCASITPTDGYNSLFSGDDLI